MSVDLCMCSTMASIVLVLILMLGHARLYDRVTALKSVSCSSALNYYFFRIRANPI